MVTRAEADIFARGFKIALKVFIAKELVTAVNSVVLTSLLRGFIIKSPPQKPFFRWAIPACYIASIVLIASALWNWGAVEVRGHGEEVVFLTFLGIAWLVVSLHLFPWFGLCVGDDVNERRNPAALVALVSATL